MAVSFAKLAFTPDVRDQQDRLGSGHYAKFLSPDRVGGSCLGADETAFIQARDGFYQATVSATGWPYVQFRGGAAGFLRVLDDKTIAYADLRGNRQYISLGNLSGNDRISLILMDYPNARRLKIWGRAKMLEPIPADWADQSAEGIAAKAERLVVIHVEAFDWNCPQHIPRRFTDSEALRKVEELEAEAAELRAALMLAHVTPTRPT
ncbi:pyridoxamine 5'-phosphate oxidase family protein [Roseobacter sp. YSTF-M11]|uniref:Pyridoxamine 5'-phosphate oxidase family protein n=1 Tax=Roseobacter insulae TaxID=2859783 RepID=A0A9X1FWY0_9RHOB|nr:pyridoxamine 5'-phosphate oxidase family protein [Roseobacter insulae]MBW4709162.1 pyridoxamine 5'-phosphate oxidase family protein [Roseobacter insulae]